MKTLNKRTYHKNHKVMDKENIPPTIVDQDYYASSSPSLTVSTKKQAGVNSNNKTKKRKSNTNNTKSLSLPRKKNGLSHISNNQKNQMIVANNNKESTNNKKKKEDEPSLSSLLSFNTSNSHVVSPTFTTSYNNIDSISRRLKDNMTKVTYKMVECLSQSNLPHDQYVFEKLFESSMIASYHKHVLSNDGNKEETLSENNNSNLAMLVGEQEVQSHHNNNNNVSLPQQQQEDEFFDFSTWNQSFDIEQENEFINTWLQQYDTGGGNGFNCSSLDQYDNFSIVTDQELSDLLSQDESFNNLYV